MKYFTLISYFGLFIFVFSLGVYSGFFDGVSSNISSINDGVIAKLPPEFTFFFVIFGLILVFSIVNILRD